MLKGRAAREREVTKKVLDTQRRLSDSGLSDLSLAGLYEREDQTVPNGRGEESRRKSLPSAAEDAAAPPVLQPRIH